MSDERSERTRFWARCVVLLLAGAWWTASLGCRYEEPGRNRQEVERPVTARGNLAQDEQTTIDVFRAASPSVVHVTTLMAPKTGTLGFRPTEIPAKTGSGFLWDTEGHVVTNFHVLSDGDAVQVVLPDQSAWPATVVGVYPDEDIAVLHIEAPADKLHPLLLGTSSDLEVGQDVYAIGNPFGLDRTLTRGIVSAVGRQVDSVTGHPMKGMIQTDAAVNPGNSGGPLLDSAGRLIGMNSAIVSPSGAFAGIGFAIPADEINRVVTQLIRQGRVIRPELGVEVAPDQWAAQLHLPGVLVLNVQPGSSAEQAGIRPTRRTANGGIKLGDVIVAMDGKPVKSTDDLFDLRDQHKVGDVVELTVLRDGSRKKVEVKLGASGASPSGDAHGAGAPK